MTLREYLTDLPDEELAEFLIKTNEYQYTDYCDCDYSTTDGKYFTSCKFALDHQVELLNSEYK